MKKKRTKFPIPTPRKADIEIYRQEILSALDILDPTNEMLRLNGVNGSIEVDGNVIYPREVVYYQEIEKLIDKRNFYLSMNGDAKAIVNFICLSDSELLTSLCGIGKRGEVTARGVARYFRAKWGRLRVKAAMREIKKLLSI